MNGEPLETSQPGGESAPLAQVRFMMPQGMASILVDGITLHNEDDMVVIALFKSEPQTGSEEGGSRIAFCQGKFVVTQRGFGNFVEALNRHFQKVQH